MATIFADWNSEARRRIVWVDFERYAYRVFAGSPSDWYSNPVRFTAAVIQAHRVIPSDVVTIDGMAPFLACLPCDIDGTSDATAVQCLLEVMKSPAPLAFIAEVVDALTHHLGDEVDFALKLQSPQDLLRSAGALSAAADFDALDEIGTALVGLVRQLSSKAFVCLQICSNGLEGMSIDEEEACDPIFRSAAYYGWEACATYSAVSTGVSVTSAVDLVLLPELPEATVRAMGGRKFGGGLDAAFWSGRGEIPQQLSLLHGVIPEFARPETVVERMRALTSLA